eukprot:SAG31_NODE_1931_length_6880_cov_6.530010_6_plen_101_part_00
METRRSIVSESSHETESVAGHGTARLVRADSDVWNPAVGAWSLHGQDYRTPSDSLQLSTGDTAAYGYVYENQRRCEALIVFVFSLHLEGSASCKNITRAL